jgi:precorrin-6x reductase
MKKPLNESFIRMQKIAGIVTENRINEGELVSKIKPSGEFKKAVIALEKYLATTGGNFDYDKLAYLIIDIKDAGASEDYDY